MKEAKEEIVIVEKESKRKIHPIVIYPFVQPKNVESINHLYEKLKKLLEDNNFSKPITVINNQTLHRSKIDIQKEKAYEKAINDIISPNSEIIYTWAIDTCAMWLRGLGDALQNSDSQNDDIYWLIPGDFNYSTKEGLEALERLPLIPSRVCRKECSLCLGEIEVPLNSAKQLIDTYGTYGLLYNWFPAEAKGIRSITTKPRSEFFAIDTEFLKRTLIEHRWFAYEQTLMILLQNMILESPVRAVSKVELGSISDPEESRSTLASAMQQVERTERALKLHWRDKAEKDTNLHDWPEEFRILDRQSESIRTAAMVILRRLLK
ncbi:MAG: hypothetical protein A3H98_04235 [Bacteroidetes bacterium RIFCSPLOWO2_02_FULL_36_8]|nr:MAG: hypothetical protein A3H98_04235 [Bacteroidetes bacterium RIFCSPLOWO2_02_FULL_36_8]